MRLLLDEMYGNRLAGALRDAGIDVSTVLERRLAGSSDHVVFAADGSLGRAVLTENVADFARIAADDLASGRHHHGLLVALSARFSRRPAGVAALVAAVLAVAGEPLADRVVYLQTTR